MVKKKDYQKKNLGNPYFNKKPRTKRRLGFFIILVVVIVMIIGGIYFFNSFKNNLVKLETEENFSLIWNSGKEKYYLDEKGVVVKKLDEKDLIIKPGEGETEIIRSEATSGIYPVVKDESNFVIEIGKSILEEEKVFFITDLTRQIKDQADFNITNYILDSPAANYITLNTDEDWIAYFTFENSIESQVDLLFSLLYQKVSNRSELEYIDLRFGEKIFWK